MYRPPHAAFYANGSGGVLVTVGLYVVPFAGMAFLWFMMAFRALPDRPADLGQGLQLASGVVVPAVTWAKLRSQAEGAKIASEYL